MGVDVGCCECSQRLAVMIIAVVSAVNSMLGTTLIVIGGEEPGSYFETTPYSFALVGGAQFVMIVISVLLFIGAYYNIFWFCLPWLCLTILSLLTLIIHTIASFHGIPTHLLIFIVFSIFLMFFMDWVVGTFVYGLIKFGKTSRSDEENRPLIRGDQ